MKENNRIQFYDLPARSKLYPVFPLDRYEEINDKYFNDILRNRDWTALPAGWWNPKIEFASDFKPVFPVSEDLKYYSVDEGFSMRKSKEKIAHILNSWDKKEYTINEFTLCTSVSSSTLAILMALKKAEFKTVIFETPAYFATIEQAKMLGFHVILIPTYIDDGFDYCIEQWVGIANEQRPAAFWITQPRFALGSNQCEGRVKKILEGLDPINALVIDQAAEQNFPSSLCELSSLSPALIRTRGFFKGMGLNGLRVSVITHPPVWRRYFEWILDGAGVSIDKYSLLNLLNISSDVKLFSTLLSSARKQVLNGLDAVKKITNNTLVRPSEVENGYMGSLFVNFSKFKGEDTEKTLAFLSYCAQEKMPVVLSSSSCFANDNRWESIRMNYFTDIENVKNSARLICGFDYRAPS